MDQQTYDDLAKNATRWLSGHPPTSTSAYLRHLADIADDSDGEDTYGKGALIERLEARMAELLGKEAALFVVSGTMAQQMALRCWTDHGLPPVVAMHPLNHPDGHESNAYQILHGLRSIHVGSEHAVLTRTDFDAVGEPVGVVLLELPQREIGSQLGPWSEIEAIRDWADEHGAALHMDGARLWECAPFYGKSLAEMAAPFDSVYVSMYKTLGALAGAFLAGPKEFIEQARVWQHRHGGRLFHTYPLLLSVQDALDTRLPKIADYCARAKGVAAALTGVDGIELVPAEPQTNMFHVYLRGNADHLRQAAADVLQSTGVNLLRRLNSTVRPNWHRAEYMIGDGALDISDDEVQAGFSEIMARSLA